MHHRLHVMERQYMLAAENDQNRETLLSVVAKLILIHEPCRFHV